MNSQVIIIDQYIESEMKPLNSESTQGKPLLKRLVRFMVRRATACLISLAQTYRLFLFRYRTRKQLAKLPEYRLDDIGLSKQQVLEESAKWFWQE